MKPLKFKNLANGYVIEIDSPEFWAFLVGPLFFAYKGVWKPAIICVIAAIFTLGVSIIFQLIILPIYAREIFCHYFLMRGWADVTDDKPKVVVPPKPAPAKATTKSLFVSKNTGVTVGSDGIPTYRL